MKAPYPSPYCGHRIQGLVFESKGSGPQAAEKASSKRVLQGIYGAAVHFLGLMNSATKG